MLKKSFPLLLVILSFHLSITCAAANLQTKQDTSRATKIKEEIVRRSAGEKKLVRIKLLDGREIKGYIAQAGADTFLISDVKTGLSTSIAYSEVKQVRGQGLSTFKKIAVSWLAVGIAITLIGANK